MWDWWWSILVIITEMQFSATRKLDHDLIPPPQVDVTKGYSISEVLTSGIFLQLIVVAYT